MDIAAVVNIMRGTRRQNSSREYKEKGRKRGHSNSSEYKEKRGTGRQSSSREY